MFYVGSTDSENSPLGWPSESFFLELCLAPSESCLLRTSDSDCRELCRPVWLETLNLALFFLPRSDSGADRLLSGSLLLSGSEPTFTNAFLVLVKAEVTEPIPEKKGSIKASVGVSSSEFTFYFFQKLLKRCRFVRHENKIDPAVFRLSRQLWTS